MQKPALLRTAIEKAVPELAANPENLGMWVVQGSVKIRKKTLGHTQSYRLCIGIVDLDSQTQDRVTLAIINWLQEWEPDLNVRAGDDGLTFEVDVLGDRTVNILYTVHLVEEVMVKVDQHNTVTEIRYRKPPQEYPDLSWPGLPSC